MNDLDASMWQLIYDKIENVADSALFGDEDKLALAKMCHEIMKLMRDVYDLHETEQGGRSE